MEEKIWENQVADIFRVNVSHRDIILGLNVLLQIYILTV